MKRETRSPSYNHDCMKDPRVARQRAEIRDLKNVLAALIDWTGTTQDYVPDDLWNRAKSLITNPPKKGKKS